MFRAFTSEAIRLLKSGESEAAIRTYLYDTYAREIVEKEKIRLSSRPTEEM